MPGSRNGDRKGQLPPRQHTAGVAGENLRVLSEAEAPPVHVLRVVIMTPGAKVL